MAVCRDFFLYLFTFNDTIWYKSSYSCVLSDFWWYWTHWLVRILQTFKERDPFIYGRTRRHKLIVFREKKKQLCRKFGRSSGNTSLFSYYIFHNSRCFSLKKFFVTVYQKIVSMCWMKKFRLNWQVSVWNSNINTKWSFSCFGLVKSIITLFKIDLTKTNCRWTAMNHDQKKKKDYENLK